MCGRMTSTTSADKIAEALGLDEVEPAADEKPPSFNVAPTQQIFAVAKHSSGMRLEMMRWGLVPFFAKDLSSSARMINARAENVTDKPAYRRSFKKRRCLIPCDGYYEWQKLESKKQPWYFRAKDGAPLAFAGLWDVWHDPQLPEDADPLISCTIITADANNDVEAIHNRMPLALTSEQWETWLDIDSVDPDEVAALLRSPATGMLDAYKISTAVNNVRNDVPELIEPI